MLPLLPQYDRHTHYSLLSSFLCAISLIGVEYYKHTLEWQLHVGATGCLGSAAHWNATQLKKWPVDSKVSWQTWRIA